MINTNKKIHIYNRFRTIYTSKNRYYIRNNKKYIDLYTIIKKATLKSRQHSCKHSRQRGGGTKDDKTFLVQELNGIKDSIVIFKLLIDDKQSEAINIYLNLIELINSKKELIINKINTYPQNYFDNELNKSAIITYVKNMLYKNIFHNYLLNIIPRIDVNNLIKETDKDAIENIIKSLLHLNHNSDKRVLQDTMLKIEKYNDILKTTIKTNCNDYETLKGIIGKYIETAWGAVNDAINEPKEAEEEAVAEGAEEEEAEGVAAEEGAAAAAAEEGAEGAAEEDGAEGVTAEEGAEDKEKKGNGNTEKKKIKKRSRTIKKTILKRL